jgi:hypothetical protein
VEDLLDRVVKAEEKSR